MTVLSPFLPTSLLPPFSGYKFISPGLLGGTAFVSWTEVFFFVPRSSSWHFGPLYLLSYSFSVKTKIPFLVCSKRIMLVLVLSPRLFLSHRSFATAEAIVGNRSDGGREGGFIWSSESPGMSEDVRNTVSFALDPAQWQPSKKEQNLCPPIFSFIAVLRRRREREARRIEHGRSKRSCSQSWQSSAIVCVNVLI